MKTIAYLTVTGLALVQGEHIRGKNEQKAGTPRMPHDCMTSAGLVQVGTYDNCGHLSECIDDAMKKGREKICKLVCSTDNCKGVHTVFYGLLAEHHTYNPIGLLNRRDGFPNQWTMKEYKKQNGCAFGAGACDYCCLEAEDMDAKQATDYCHTHNYYTSKSCLAPLRGTNLCLQDPIAGAEITWK